MIFHFVENHEKPLLFRRNRQTQATFLGRLGRKYRSCPAKFLDDMLRCEIALREFSLNIDRERKMVPFQHSHGQTSEPFRQSGN